MVVSGLRVPGRSVQGPEAQVPAYTPSQDLAPRTCCSVGNCNGKEEGLTSPTRRKVRTDATAIEGGRARCPRQLRATHEAEEEL